jgi:hypothetical protein
MTGRQTNAQPNAGFNKTDISLRLYSIRNIAVLAAKCPQESVEVYLLQDVVSHLADMAQSLIEDIGA